MEDFYNIIVLLPVIFVMYIAFILTRASAKVSPSTFLNFCFKCSLWVIGIALFASITLGALPGICDGPNFLECAKVFSYNPTFQQRVSTFGFTLVFLYLPVLIGAYMGYKERAKHVKGHNAIDKET
jgi:hypothetical protein